MRTVQYFAHQLSQGTMLTDGSSVVSAEPTGPSKNTYKVEIVRSGQKFSVVKTFVPRTQIFQVFA